VLNEKSTMHRLQRLIAASVLIALSGAIGGCSNNISSFDPMDWFDWLDTKKKLPGDRKPVFPEGVPGLEQGVPKSLYKGASQQEVDQNTQAAVAPPPDAQPKRSAKSKSKQPAATATADPAAAPDEDATAAAPPAPKPKKIVRQRTTAPPSDQPPDAQSGAPQAQPAPAQQSSAPFPAPLPGGTFTR
jgi:hypothetical protein